MLRKPRLLGCLWCAVLVPSGCLLLPKSTAARVSCAKADEGDEHSSLAFPVGSIPVLVSTMGYGVS